MMGVGGVMQQVRKAIGGMSVLSSFEFNIFCKFDIYYGFLGILYLGVGITDFTLWEVFSISGFIGGWGF